MMLEVDGLFYHFILILGWKWSSIIYRYWLNQLRYITYEELTQVLFVSLPLFSWDTLPMRNWHNLVVAIFINSYWRYITYEELTPGHCSRTAFTTFLRYITYEELTHSINVFMSTSVIRDTLPMRNWHKLPHF